MLLVHLVVLLCTLLGLSSAVKSKSVDVLAKLKSKAPDCDLRGFVREDDQKTLLEEDLKKFCPESTLIHAGIVCRAIHYELRKACSLPEDKRPKPTTYDRKPIIDETCNGKTIVLTTDWIWKTLKLDNNTLELTKENFCTKLATPDETRGLVRFFYRIAPRVRRADLPDETLSNDVTSPVLETTKKAVVVEVQQAVTKPVEVVQTTNATVVKSENNQTNTTVNQLEPKVIEAVKSKIDETLSKTVEVTKSGVGTVSNVSTNTTVVSVSNTTLATVASTTKNVTQLVLDVNVEKTKTVVANKKKESIDDPDEEDDEEVSDEKETKTKPKENEPIGQIPKPGIETETKNKNNNSSTVLVIPPTVEKNTTVAEVPPTKPTSTVAPIEEEKKAEDVESKPKVTAAVLPEDNDDTYDPGNGPDDDGRPPKKAKNEGQDDYPPAGDSEDDIEKEYSMNTEQNRDYSQEEKPVDNSQVPEVKKPSERRPEKKGKDKEPETVIYQPAKSRDRYPEDEGWSGNFVTYFLLLTLFVVVGYLILHNKNKLMGYFVEGRRTGSSRTGSRPSHRHYEQIKNVNDVIDLDMNTNIVGGSTKKDPNIL